MEYKSFMEALKGKQHKIDKNKNGQIDSHDFKLLRKEEADLFEAGPHDPDFVEKSARHERLYTYHKRMGNDTEAAKHKAEIDKLYKKEETEELDEIHRMKTKLNTLDDISNKSVARQKLSNLMKSGKARGALIANKMRTLNMGEEVEIDETWSKEQLASIHSMHDKMSKSVGLDPSKKYGTIITKKKSSADKVMDKAIKDEMKEEVEQIDELSPKTLGSYVKKATSSNDARSISNLSSKAAYKLATTDGEDEGEEEDHKSYKRSASISKAVNRLTKEEVELEEAFKSGDHLKDSLAKIQTHKRAAEKNANDEYKYHYHVSKYHDALADHYFQNGQKVKANKHKTLAEYHYGKHEDAASGRVSEEVEQIEEKSEQAKQNKTMKNMMDASRGARYKYFNNPVPDAEPEHKTAQAHNKAIGRALRSEDKMTTTKDKAGKLISFKYEGDWKKSTEKKQGSGKAANLAGQAMQKMAKANEQAAGRALRKEDVEQIDEGPFSNGQLKPSKEALANLRKTPSTFTLRSKDEKGIYTSRTVNGKEISRVYETKEEKDEQEYGYEGDMALNQLATLTRCAEMIKEILKPDTDMPEWVQSKITLATDYIQTAADYMHSEMNEAKSVEVKVNAAGDAAHEEKWEAVKKIKKPVKESFDDEGNLIANKVSYKEFMLEYTPGPGGVTQIKGRSYGASYSDPEGADDYDDKKPIKPAAEKRGRGRPAGAKSGARKITGTSKLMNK